MRLDALDNMCPLSVKLRSVPIVRFLLALHTSYVSPEFFIQTNEPPFQLLAVFAKKWRTYVFQPIALMILEQTMRSTVMAVAEPTVPDDSLCALFAVLIRAADLLGWHAAAERHGHVQSCFAGDVVVCQGEG